MKYCLALLVILAIFAIEASRKQSELPIRLFHFPDSELEDYTTYKDNDKFTKLSCELTQEERRHLLPLLALEAWRRLYDDGALLNKETVFEYEKSIAASIIESLKGEDCMHAVTFKHTLNDSYKNIIGVRHILHYLFAVPSYSVIMRDLWQEIKMRPDQKILNFFGKGRFYVRDLGRIYNMQKMLGFPIETKTFLEVVFESLKKKQPNVLSKLKFLWDYNFLSTEWLQALRNKIMQECDEDELPRLCAIKLISRLLQYSYQQRLLTNRDHKSLVDVVITLEE